MLANEAVKQLPILILISFDGFRPDYLSPELTPNLYDLSRQATLGHMRSLYVTKTFPNHFSIATGLWQDEHEIVQNQMYDPRLNETFKPGNNEEIWWNPEGTTTPIWVANQISSEDRHSGCMMYPGSPTPFRGVTPNHLKDYDNIGNWTKNVDTVVDWLMDDSKPANFVAMYFDQPDSTAHTHGPWGQATKEAVRKVDGAAGYLIKRLRDIGLADSTNILFVSDHGMAEVRKVIYLDKITDTSTFDMYGKSPDWSLFVKPEFRNRKSQIFELLVSVSRENHFRIYKREDIPPQYHYSKSDRIGDFFILTDENYDLFPSQAKSQQNNREVWGNHGWKPSDKDMRPLFMAYGPSFKKSFYHRQEFPNIDLFPLMIFLLGLPSNNFPNNGSLANIIDIIDVGHFENNIHLLKRKLSEGMESEP